MTLRLTLSPGLQVQRSAQAIKNGDKILAEVRSNKARLIAAADQGVPPVSAVSEILQEQFPKEMRTAPVRQFVGTAVKAVLVEAGYEVLQSGVRLPRDPVFSSGSVYRKATVVGNKKKAAVRDAFARMVTGLTLAEKRILMDVLRTGLGES